MGETITYWVSVFMSSTFILLMLLSVYVGLIPQLIGVAPEKAIKLTVSFLLFEFTCHLFRLSLSQKLMLMLLRLAHYQDICKTFNLYVDI